MIEEYRTKSLDTDLQATHKSRHVIAITQKANLEMKLQLLNRASGQIRQNHTKSGKKTIEQIEESYNELIKLGATPQEARSILPNSLKTEIVMTMNLREWRHFFKLRTSRGAHPQMREIAIPLLQKFKEMIPIVFEDIMTN